MADESRKPIEFPKPGDRSPANDPNQVVFDTITGPNLRWKDNLIQLSVIVVGTVLCAAGGFAYAQVQGFSDRAFPAVAGGFAGLLVSLFLSGTILGLVRGYRAMKN